MRPWTTLVCVAIVAAASWGAKQTASAAWQSVVKYQTPYQFHQPLPGGKPLARRVVLVVLDGVRLDLARQRMPFLTSLRRAGADGVVRVGQPSLSNPGRAVMVTGAWQEVNGVTFNSGYNPITVDTIFSLAEAAKMKTAVAGSGFWQDNFTAQGAESLLRYSKELHNGRAEQYVEYQSKICAALPDLVRASPAQFLALDLTATDDASHDLGPFSSAAEQTYALSDNCLKQIVQAVSFRDTVLIATADHGHIDTGGHGGSEPAVMNVPLIMAGGPVRSGTVFTAQQIDIAPTICALLGLPFPATNQGQVLLETLDVTFTAAKEIEARHAEQAAAFEEFQTGLLGSPSAEARIRAERLRIAPAAIAVLLLIAICTVLYGVVLGDSEERRAALVAVVVFYAVYFGIFKLAGLAYSFSVVNREESLPRFFMKDMGAAAIALLAATFVAGLFITNFGWSDRPRIASALTALVVATFGFQLAVVYWLNGLFMTYWMLDLRLGIWGYFNLLAVFALGFAMLLTPLTLAAGQALKR